MDETAGAETDGGGGRSARKHAAIVDAAREVFLGKGFGGATMEEVAARAAVSKQTVYKHFADKRHLFTAVISAAIAAAERPTRDAVATLSRSDALEQDLRRFARQHVTDVLRPEVVRLRRMVIAEAERFPDLARSWYRAGPERAHTVLAEQFAVLARRGLLRTEDPLLAAEHFNWLVLSPALNRAMFEGGTAEDDPADLHRYADEAVRVFLAAYGITRPATP